MIPAHTDFRGFCGLRVHLGVTGSIAAYRAVEILRRLQLAGLNVGVTLTASAQQFINPLQFRSLTQAPVYEALFAQDQASYAHLEPGQNAKVFLIAPATANILAKHVAGIGDDLLSTQILAFPGPIIHAPAMNPRIWQSWAVQNNLTVLRRHDVHFVEPEKGALACGETGIGRLATTEQIFLATLRHCLTQDLAGRRVLINLGPTQEFIDPVRILTNRSSGIMGASLAVAAWLRGAQVHVVHGPVNELLLPPDIHQTAVVAAREMHTACLDLASSMDIICLSAAVCDFRPRQSHAQKIKKNVLGDQETLIFDRNPDILTDIGKTKRHDQTLVGFAAETTDLEAEAQRKLIHKNLDLVVANRVDLPGSGFAVPTNRVMVLDRHSRQESWPPLAKTEVAMRIFDWIIAFASA